ncbi:MAG: VWA domain-containing protein [Rhabdochlamydiaceae bacterium]|jgi:Mg-chelatase subunit ChlD
MKSSLNTARLVIDAPEQKEQGFQGTFHFCVDISDSMNDRIDGVSRIERVKIALKQIVGSALNETKKSGKFFLSITVFNTKGTVLLQRTRLTSDTVRAVVQKIEGIRCDGATDILAGLNKTATVMKGRQKEGRSTAILLTDGVGTVFKGNLDRIKDVFANQSTELVVIGIKINGENNKATLQQIAASDVVGFRGQYIDVPDEKNVGNVITEVYRKRIDSFSQIELTVPRFPLGKWEVRGAGVVLQDKGAKFELDPLIGGNQELYLLCLMGQNLKIP